PFHRVKGFVRHRRNPLASDNSKACPSFLPTVIVAPRGLRAQAQKSPAHSGPRRRRTCRTCSWLWPHANSGCTSLDHAGRGSRTLLIALNSPSASQTMIDAGPDDMPHVEDGRLGVTSRNSCIARHPWGGGESDEMGTNRLVKTLLAWCAGLLIGQPA